MRRSSGLLVALFVSASTVASAQGRWTVELRGGPAFPTKTFAGSDLKTGFGFEGTVAFRIMPHLAAYAGWDWHRFGESSGAGSNAHAEETGYAFGLRFEHPLGNTGSPMVRIQAGGTYDHVEIESGAGDVIEDSGHSLGWEAGAGIILPLGEKWRLVPGARFRALSADFEGALGAADTDLRYVAIEIGVSRVF